ncbi:MAG TPA: chromosome partitioning protein ParB [Flavobacteriales bacterium]|jgi:ParB family chromosome partitioning protein|nr:chromosome partitioning protein ParB [Flavobacteriales bacterium]
MAKKSKKPALGRGLGALLQAQQAEQSELSQPAEAVEAKQSGEPAVDMAGRVALLPISAIEANPDQPRRTFEPFALNELAESIKTLGIIQPLTVRRLSAAKYQLISGERRFRASQLADLEQVPAYVREANDQEMLEMALVENIQREDLDAIEVAISFRRLMEECSLTQEELASRVGKQRSTISNYIRLLGLPALVQQSVAAGHLSFGHARVLAGLQEIKNQKALYQRIIAKGLNVRQTEREASEMLGRKPSKKIVKGAALSLQMQTMRAHLRSRFSGRTLDVKAREDGAGRVELYFQNADDLQHLLDELGAR